MEPTHHTASPVTTPVQHEPYARGDVVAAGAWRAFLRFRWAGRLPERVWLRVVDGPCRRVELAAVARHDDGYVLRARVEAARPGLRYQLELSPPEGGFVGPLGGPYAEPERAGWWQVQLDALPSFETPSWAAGCVLYQIFPDRFFNGTPANDPPGTVAWDAAPSLTNFFGGDLEGIRRRLDYLADLGVGALYLNPIVRAPSNHRYDASDDREVDPALGSADDVRRLADELHRRGMRLILDAVFNHTGETFWAFQDVVRRGPESPYWHWYLVRRWPIVRTPPSYECWWGLPHLPKLNTDHPGVREHLFEVTRWWMELGADGWRLDVPNEVGGDFWRVWRRHVKTLNPQAYIVGEIWHDALEWLQGDQFDAVMNYVLRDALVDFFVHRGRTGRELTEALHDQAARYPGPAFFTLMNLLGSHDTERILTVADGRLEPVRAMWFWLLTWPGMPSIYYGDEVGLTGGKDPDCRRTFPWDERRQDLRLWRWVRRLVRWRRGWPALQRGEAVPVEAQGSEDVAAFARAPAGPGDCPALAVTSRSPEPTRVRLVPAPGLPGVEDGAGAWVDLLSGRRLGGARAVELELEPWGLALLAWLGRGGAASRLAPWLLEG